jgi:anti-sigma regulatory factor (Ser/Thr protein kinase)
MDTMAAMRPTVLRPRRISLAAGPAASAAARSHVRAAIRAWDVPVDVDTAILLTSELVTNALRHEKSGTIGLTITCVCGQLRVDVHDTSRRVPMPVNTPVDAEAGRGLLLVARLATDWGFHPTPEGKAVYFTLAFAEDLDQDGGSSPHVYRAWAR